MPRFQRGESEISSRSGSVERVEGWFSISCLRSRMSIITLHRDGMGEVARIPLTPLGRALMPSLVDKIISPLILEHNPKARVILGLYGMEPKVAGGIAELATKLPNGWKPEWLYALEYDEYELDDAPLFPAGIPRIFFPMFTTAMSYEGLGNCVQVVGGEPDPDILRKMFRKTWDQCGIRGGTGCYSEGVHDFINQIIMMQLAWDPERSGDEILDEVCRYYFGEKAAPWAKNAILLMENEKDRKVTDPLTKQDKQIKVLVQRAEAVMPDWAKLSREWATIVGRSDIDVKISREAELMKEFDKHWGRYRALLTTASSASRPSWLQDTGIYFRNVLDNSYEIVQVDKNMNRHVVRDSRRRSNTPGGLIP